MEISLDKKPAPSTLSMKFNNFLLERKKIINLFEVSFIIIIQNQGVNNLNR